MTRVVSALLGSLVPWVALHVTLLAGDTLNPGSRVGFAVAGLFFVAAPSMVPIAVARSWVTRLAVTGVMTGVAVFVAVQMMSIDDGQAGFAVIYVPMVAFPLAAVVSTCEAALERHRAGQGWFDR